MTELPKNYTFSEKDLNQKDAEIISEMLVNLLSDKFGFCINGCGWELKLTALNIDWDIDEEDE